MGNEAQVNTGQDMTFNTMAAQISDRYRHGWRFNDDNGTSFWDAINETGEYSCFACGPDSMFKLADGSILGTIAGREWYLIDHRPTLTPAGRHLLLLNGIDPMDFPSEVVATLEDGLGQVWAVELADGTYHDVNGSEWVWTGSRHTGRMVSA